MTPFIALSDKAPALLAACDHRLQRKDGTPHHSAIATAAGVSRNTWWGIRNRTRGLGQESIGKLVVLAVKSGYTEEQAMTELFVVVDGTRTAA